MLPIQRCLNLMQMTWCEWGLPRASYMTFAHRTTQVSPLTLDLQCCGTLQFNGKSTYSRITSLAMEFSSVFSCCGIMVLLFASSCLKLSLSTWNHTQLILSLNNNSSKFICSLKLLPSRCCHVCFTIIFHFIYILFILNPSLSWNLILSFRSLSLPQRMTSSLQVISIFSS